MIKQKLTIFFYTLFAIFIFSCSDTSTNQPQETNPFPNAKPYEVFKVQDKSYPGRKRIEWDIVSPEADEEPEIRDTLKKAMEDMKKQVKADTYMIYMYKEKVAGKNLPKGFYIYAPDGKGFGDNDFKEKLEVNKRMLWDM
ncbi:DUF4875 domain-containing protein [Persephonella sp.]